MKHSKTLKIVGSLAIVGTIAAVAIFSTDAIKSSTNFLAEEDGEVEVKRNFQNFLNKHNKNYLTKTEYDARYGVFKQNLAKIKAHKDGEDGYSLGLNKFADMSEDEFNNMLGLKVPETTGEEDDVDINEEGPSEEDEDEEGRNLQSIPASVDWRQSGAVSYIKNQASCGSCYTFATAAVIESAYKIKKGSLPNLSEQQLLDCTTSYGNMGCSGGYIHTMWQYMMKNKIMQESDYPYVAYKKTCAYKSTKGLVNVNAWYNVARNDPNAHMRAIAKQPIAGAVAASSSVYMFYKGGIISSTSCGTALNHAVTFVGYGTENGVNYWLLKNSWGTNWGEKGYFRIRRDSTSGPGICGVLGMSSYGTIA